ncbi:hypothetical protein MKX01_037832 [Papaver californicum]|nr:hypothetical protein MKX01_037832 [Papaver californicum]
MVGGLMSSLTDAIEAYTGLSPVAFFTILCLMFGVYKLVCGIFFVPEDFNSLRSNYIQQLRHSSSSSSPSVPISEPVQLGDVAEEELRAYDGSDPNKPLLMAIKSQIYDVSRSRMFYGPGGPYSLFAGRDASRALALLSFEPKDLTGNTEGLSSSELDTLQDWEDKFVEKYVQVGRIISEAKLDDNLNGDKAEGNLEQFKEEPNALKQD